MKKLLSVFVIVFLFFIYTYSSASPQEQMALKDDQIENLQKKNEALEKEIAILNAKRMADPMNTVWEDAAFSNAQMRLCP